MQPGRKPSTPGELRRAARLGRWLRRRRDAFAMVSAQHLADQAGVSVDLIRKIEAGKVADPGFFTMGRLVAHLDVTLDDLYRAAGRAK